MNTVQNGKGSKPRKNVNYRAYWSSDLWDNLKKTREEPIKNKPTDKLQERNKLT